MVVVVPAAALRALLTLPMGQLERLMGGRLAIEFVRHDCLAIVPHDQGGSS